MDRKLTDTDIADDFEDILSDAESNARGSWEDDFLSGLREKWEQYGERMYFSEKQEEILLRIAKW